MVMSVGAPTVIDAATLGGKSSSAFSLAGDTNIGIGGTTPLYVDTTAGLYISPNAEHWLETGQILRNVGDYPDAKVSNDGADYVGIASAKTDTDSGLPIFVRIK